MIVLLGIAFAASWNVQLARMEGAATDIKQSAEELNYVANEIIQSGRFQHPARLFDATQEVHKQIQSARLATEQLGTN